MCCYRCRQGHSLTLPALPALLRAAQACAPVQMSFLWSVAASFLKTLRTVRPDLLGVRHCVRGAVRPRFYPATNRRSADDGGGAAL